ncbi:hypothetical protein BIU92_03135 [Curtobacterium sp. MCBA15_003]|nr:hypothetical protein BIU92_03135 [Curtobacterium sp. MCBA15_003]
MVTVKAAPEPSRTYIDTVCVAGVRVDREVAEWIRLYPVPFRHLSTSHQFAKYDLIEVDTVRARHDSRAESRRPVWDSLEVVGRVEHKAARDRILGTLPSRSMCELIGGVQSDPDAQSLGLVSVRQLQGFSLSKHPGWSTAQQRAIESAIAQPPLFGESEKAARPLEPPRFTVRIRYRCEAEACNGHEPSLLDFELAALQHRGRHRSDEALQAMILQKFRDEQFNEGLRTSLFVGNIADPPKRRSFSALGVHHVPRDSDWSSTLF